jgi:spermidine synthase
MPAYALTIFIGAFLLFQVQPLIGKYILPWFGGGPGVWTTCMLFFQLLLLAGYAYAHFVSSYLKPRKQAILHLVLLVAAVASLPIIPSDRWKPQGTENPTVQILALLGVTLGLPYLVLSTTGPLMQQWFSRTNRGASPYRLYALSNIGSLLALLTYPFYFEAHFTRKTQTALWAYGLVAYALCCGFCAFKMFRQSSRATDEAPEAPAAGTASDPSSQSGVRRAIRRFFWIALPACASLLLLAITSKICQDVAVIPFLWVLPLAIYLLSFIISFDSPRWYVRAPFGLALVAGISAICWALERGTEASIYAQVSIYCLGLFACCMVCHGELYRLRPEPRQLTSFYLSIAFGGALGGIFAAAIAPMIFPDYYELQWGLLLCGLLYFLVCAAAPQQPANSSRLLAFFEGWQALAWILVLSAFVGFDWFVHHLGSQSTHFSKTGLIWVRVAIWAFFVGITLPWIVRGQMKQFRHWRILSCVWLALGLAVLGATLWIQVHSSSDEKIFTTRNFYGVLAVYEHRKDEPEGHHFLLQHGRITHGLQFVDPELAKQPTTYYAQSSGVGLGVQALPAGPRRIGVVGLGTGSMAVYARPGDYVRIYEINPEVKKLATSRFKYVPNCAGTVEIAIGDARLSMEREPPQRFDLLVLDAFSSDAIPVHLLTKEAFELYDRHLNSNGIVAVHISNHYLDLEPVVANLAKHFQFESALIDFEENEEEWWLYASTWILLTRDADTLDQPQIRSTSRPAKAKASVPLWTDDFASLFQILRR